MGWKDISIIPAGASQIFALSTIVQTLSNGANAVVLPIACTVKSITLFDSSDLSFREEDFIQTTPTALTINLATDVAYVDAQIIIIAKL